MPVKKKIAKNEKKVVKKKTVTVKPNAQTVKKSATPKKVTNVKAASVNKAVSKKATPKKATVKQTAPKKATVKQTAPKKATVKQTAPKKVTVKKTAVKKTTVKKTASTKKQETAKKPVKTTSTKKAVTKKQLPVKGATAIKTPKQTKVKVEKKVNKVSAGKKDINKGGKPTKTTKTNKKVVAKKAKATVTKKDVNENEIRIPPKPNVRYSDEDLKMFHGRIVEMRKEAIEELRMLRERLDDLTNYDFAEESMIYSMHMAEQGSEAFEKEKTYAQIQRINEYIKKLDEALGRIKDKSFGICRVCGCLIAKERLLAVPITTLSASYKIQKRCPDDGIDRIEPLKNVE